MLRKIIALFVVFGVAVADPVARLAVSTPDDLDLSPTAPEIRSDQQLQRIIPESAFVLLDAFNALAGFKVTAIGFGVLVIEWLVSNAIVIIIGAAAAVGLCKVTGKCNLNYEAYVPVAQLKNLVTPEYIETAEKFLVTAVEKYAEKKGRAARDQWFY